MHVWVPAFAGMTERVDGIEYEVVELNSRVGALVRTEMTTAAVDCPDNLAALSQVSTKRRCLSKIERTRRKSVPRLRIWPLAEMTQKAPCLRASLGFFSTR